MQAGGIYVSDQSIADVKEIQMSDNGGGDYIRDPQSFSILNHGELEILQQFQSGQSMQLEIAILDNDGQQVLYIDQPNFLISCFNTTVSKCYVDFGKQITSFNQTTGVSTIKNVIMMGQQLSNHQIIITSDHQKLNGIQLLFNISFTGCKIGYEIQRFDDFPEICVQCSSGYYSLEQPLIFNQRLCNECPQKMAQCQGGNDFQVLTGFWRIDNNSDQIHECVYNEQNCLGKDKCFPGTSGTLCKECDYRMNYVKNSKLSCIECQAETTQIVQLVIILIFLMLLKIINVKSTIGKLSKKLITISVNSISQKVHKVNSLKEEIEMNALLKIFISYFQIITIVLSSSRAPSFLMLIFNLFGNPAEQTAYSQSCFILDLAQKYEMQQHYIALMINLSMPIGLITLYSMYIVLSLRKNVSLIKYYLTTSAIYFYFFFMPSMFKQFISILGCVEYNKKYFMVIDTNYECYTDEYYQGIKFVVPITLFFVGIIPILLIYKIYRSRNNMTDFCKYYYLTSEYKRNGIFSYFEFLKLYFKFIIMIVTVFIERIQSQYISMGLIVLYLGVIKTEPYLQKYYQLNKIEFNTHVVALITIYAAGFLETQNITIFYISISFIIIFNFYMFLKAMSLMLRAIKQKLRFVILKKKKSFIEKFIQCCFFSQAEQDFAIYIKWRGLFGKITAEKKFGFSAISLQSMYSKYTQDVQQYQLKITDEDSEQNIIDFNPQSQNQQHQNNDDQKIERKNCQIIVFPQPKPNTNMNHQNNEKQKFLKYVEVEIELQDDWVIQK